MRLSFESLPGFLASLAIQPHIEDHDFMDFATAQPLIEAAYADPTLLPTAAAAVSLSRSPPPRPRGAAGRRAGGRDLGDPCLGEGSDPPLLHAAEARADRPAPVRVPRQDSPQARARPRQGAGGPAGRGARYGSFLEPRRDPDASGYVSIGARVGAGSLVDTWATVGSCAQIGKNVHLAGGVGIGGVLEPPAASPVIVEDEVFVGSRCVLVEGNRRAGRGARGHRVVITGSTPILDVSGSAVRWCTA